MFNNERNLEQLRFAVSRRANLCLRKAFQLIDTDHDDFVRSAEIRDYLAANGFYATDRELTGLITLFDPDNKSRISMDQFVQ